VVVKVAWVGWSFGGDLGGGGAGGALVDDGLAGGECGGECLEGEVVDCSGVAAVGLVDQGGGVVGEQGVAASGEGEVVALMRSSSLAP
jgi:hypothetical protein